jgi:Transposase DDE domain
MTIIQYAWVSAKKTDRA